MKKTLFIITTITSLGLTSCSSSNQKTNTTESKATSTDFVKTLEGKIGDKNDIVAKLTSNSGQISGTYFYKKKGGNIQVKGTIDSIGNLAINEFDDKGNQTGMFKGKYSNNRIDGNWSKPNGNNSMNFYLIESNTTYESSQLQTTQQNQDSQESNLPPSNFVGKWSNEGDGTATSRLEMDVDQIDTKMEGTITYEEWDTKGETQLSSGLCSIIGTVKGGTALIQIYSPKGALQTEGKLIKDGDYIKFILTKADNFFPKELIVWK